MKTHFTRNFFQITSLLLLAGALNVQAVNLLKTATATMNATTDWTLSGTDTAPSSTYVGEFNNTPTSGNLSSMQLGANISLLGLLFDNNMAGPLTVGNTGSYTLSIYGSGINMTAANYDVTLNCTVSPAVASQTWNVQSGRTLTIGSAISTGTGSTTYSLTINNGNTGTVNLSGFTENYANDGFFMSLLGGNVSLGAFVCARTSSYTTAPTATAPISATTTSGLYVNGATATATTITIGNGSKANSSSSMLVASGSLTASGAVVIGKNTGSSRWNPCQVSGGTFTVSDTSIGLQLSPQYSASVANYAELYVSGGTATIGKISYGASGDTAGGTGWVIVKGTGNLYVGSGGIVLVGGGSYSANISLYSGLLGASADWSSSLAMQLSGPVGTPFTIQAADSGGTAHNITLSGSISGVGSLTKTGGGTLTLSGANSYAGNTLISAGTLQVGNGSTTGNLGTADATAITDNGTLAYNHSDNVTYSGVISGSSGALSQLGSGKLILTGNNTYGGATTISAGTLQVDGASGAINSSSGITVSGGAKYLHTASTASTRTITQTLGTVDGTGTLGTVNVANNSANVVQNGNGGTTTLTIGTLAFSGAATINVAQSGTAGTSVISVTGGLTTTPANGTITINATIAGGAWTSGTTYNLIHSGSGSITVGNFAKGTVPGLTSRQSASLVQVDANTIGLQITGDSPKWTGKDSANWVVGSTGANGNWQLILGGTATDYVEGDGVLFDDTATSEATPGSVNISSANVNPTTTTFANSSSGISTYTVSGSYGIASGSVTKNNNGTLVLNTANSYSGGTTVNGGTIQAGNNSALGAGGLTFGAASSGKLQVNGNSVAIGRLSGDSTATIENANSAAGSLTVSSGTGSYSGTLQNGTGGGALSLAVSGASTLTLSGSANTYSGGTTVSAGQLNIANSSAIGSGALTLSGGTIDNTSSGSMTLANNNNWNGNFTYAGSLYNLILSSAGSVTLNATPTVTVSANTLEVDGQITGGYGLTKAGNGTLILGGNNNYSGLTTVSAGTLTLSSASSLSGGTTLNAGQLNINNNTAIGSGTFTIAGGTIDNTGSGDVVLGTIPQNWNGDFTYAGSLHNLDLGNGSVTLGATRQVTVNANTLTVDGAISGSSYGLTKAGAGTMVLTGNNSYGGATTVNAGVLQLNSGGVINNSAANAVNANATAQLVVAGGSLTSASLNIATYSLGLLESSGSVSFSGALTMNSGSSQASQNGLISVTGGSLSAGSLAMGRMSVYLSSQPTAGYNNIGYYQNGGSVNISGNVSVCTQSAANSANSMRIDSGSLTVGGSVTLGGGSSGGRWTPLDVNGGTLTVNDTTTGINVGNNNNGTAAGCAELLIRGGTTTAGRIGLGATASGYTGTAVLTQTNGSLYVGSGGIVYNGYGTAAINLTNGILGAAADWSSSMAMTLAGATIQAADSGGTAHNITLSGGLGGTTLTKTGNGTLTLTSAGNYYTGLTTISGGILNINSQWALGGAVYGGLTFSGSGGTLQYASTLLNTTTDISAQPVSLNANATIDVNGNAINFANSIGNSGSGALTVASTAANGVLSLQGANTYTGGTTVSSGTLKVNNTSGSGTGSGSVTVQSSATLGGSGTISGAVTFATGALVLFNNSTPLTISGALIASANVVHLNLTNNVPPGTYLLASYNPTGSSGSFAATPVIDSGSLAAGGTATITTAAGQVNLVVPAAASATVLTASANPSGYLNNIVFTATLTGFGTPTGTVQFLTNGAAFGGPVGLIAGVVSTNLATLSRGTNTIIAEYSGDSFNLPSTSSLLEVVTNHPPVVNPNTYSRGGLNSWKIKVTDLLTNASDADFDTLTLDNVATSTNGINVVISGGYVQYYNTNLVDDQFTFAVTDGFGGTNSAVITLTIGSSTGGAAGQISSFTVTGGTASMTFAGIPGYSYHVQVSTDMSNWNTLWTTNAPAGGVFQFDDSNAPQPNAFYRLMWDGL